MPITLNHTIISARDPDASARFVADLLGLDPPKRAGPFTMVEAGPTSLDYVRAEAGPIASRHFAFLVSEAEFDGIFGRIEGQGMPHWADPGHERPGINRYDDGRGTYFNDPDGHNLEILTRPYCCAGPDAAHPHPLCYG